MSFQINVFGTKAVVGQGGRIRKSPGISGHAACVGRALSGKKPGSRKAVHAALASASRSCGKGR